MLIGMWIDWSECTQIVFEGAVPLQVHADGSQLVQFPLQQIYQTRTSLSPSPLLLTDVLVSADRAHRLWSNSSLQRSFHRSFLRPPPIRHHARRSSLHQLFLRTRLPNRFRKPRTSTPPLLPPLAHSPLRKWFKRTSPLSTPSLLLSPMPLLLHSLSEHWDQKSQLRSELRFPSCSNIDSHLLRKKLILSIGNYQVLSSCAND